ncbi:MAG TPA: hypothetical protein VKZ50_15990 [bacterium]|nr:hypothetical protein [bacterium]
MASKREYKVIWMEDRGSVEGALNQAARGGFKIVGTTAQAIILEGKTKGKNKDDDDEDDDDDEEEEND